MRMENQCGSINAEPSLGINPCNGSFEVSPCKFCITRKSMGKSWIASECLQSCSILNPLGSSQISCTADQQSAVSHFVKCPFEGCENVMGIDSLSCQTCKSKLYYRRYKMGIPPDLIYLKNPPKEFPFYKWEQVRPRKKRVD